MALPAAEPVAAAPLPVTDPSTYFAFLDQLPVAPYATAAAAAALPAGRPVAAAGAAAHHQHQHHDSEEADEDYVPPPSAREHAHHRQQHAAAPAAHRGGGSAHCANARRRGIGGNSGRVHKPEHKVYQQQHRHHYHQQQHEEEQGGLGALLPRGHPQQLRRFDGGAMGRSRSANPGLQQHLANGAGHAAYQRSWSSPACSASSSLGSLITATKLFGPILGALGGPAGTALPSGGASPSKQHLFGGSWGAAGAGGGATNGATLSSISNGTITTRPR